MDGLSEKEGVLGFVGFDDVFEDVFDDAFEDVFEDVFDDVVLGVGFVRCCCCEGGVDFGVEALMAILVLHIGK